MKMNFDIPGDLPETLPVLPLKQGFLLPGVTAPFAVGRPQSLQAIEASDGWLLVGLQKTPKDEVDPAEDLLPIGVLARILHPIQRPDGLRAVVLQGVARVHLTEFVENEEHLEAKVRRIEESWPETAEAEGLLRALLDVAKELAERLNMAAPVQALVQGLQPTPHMLVDAMGAMLESELQWKHDLLVTLDPTVRGKRVLERANEISQVLQVQQDIETKVRSDAKDMEREAILRRQLDAIKDELGEGEGGELGDVKKKLEELPLPEEARSAVDRELARFDRIPKGSPERNVSQDWLEWVSQLPWGKLSSTGVDLDTVDSALGRSHHGLDEVKKQVVEHLAVRKLSGSGRADVLLLVGPPGVGKTSIAEAIAEATERKLVRVALGGVRDESELRGHRRTYVGARPGRLIEGVRRGGTQDPVVLLDEVDKLTRSMHGDPAAALLEVLDPEQNHAFTDHYLEVPFDLSKVLFIATANDLSTVPAPLLDRMEIVHIEGYTRLEKRAIARQYVLPKLAKNAGLDPEEVEITDAAIEDAVDGWTREAGVRQLQRTLGKVFRAAAVKKARGELEAPFRVDVDDLKGLLGRRKHRSEAHEAPRRAGIATGLAWTPMGGDVLYVEASDTPGRGNLVLTGQLGEVMKESARAALTYTLSHADELAVPEDVLEKKDIHVHVPAGATPKDGPSAGVTMFTAIASLLSGRPVRPGLAMTGEVSLRGRVLPVGGIKSKVLAAHERGIGTVLLPKANEPDAEDLPDEVREQVELVFVDDMSQVLDRALKSRAPGLGLSDGRYLHA
ncbi:MAG TPA: endopeptidase La [Myxococcales bacterium LLY-WYZ-16_1]|nr:endopeptidase La [Myxococcales bacterium LLY-WYZ-16_1]